MDDFISMMERLVKKIDQELTAQRRGNIHPTEGAAVVQRINGQMCASPMIWGFPHFKQKGVIFKI